MADTAGAVLSGSIVHPDGIYINLPMADYVNDRALSGSGFKKLNALPSDWKWEHPSNLLYREPVSNARLLGTLVHKAVLEGLTAFYDAYALPPQRDDHPDAIDTVADAKAWLNERGAKVSGNKPELIERIIDIDPHAKIWDVFVAEQMAGRVAISAEDHKYVLLVETFLRANPRYRELLTRGLAELSVFWTEIIDGVAVRLKARFDYINRKGVLDVKKFGKAPPPGCDLVEHLLNEATYYSYDVQAVHNVRAAAELGRLFDGELVFGGGRGEREMLASIIPHDKAKIDFRWLFVRTPGAPTAQPLRYSRECAPEMWTKSEQKIARAVREYIAFTRRFGDGHWLQANDECDAGDERWPMRAAMIARESEYEEAGAE